MKETTFAQDMQALMSMHDQMLLLAKAKFPDDPEIAETVANLAMNEIFWNTTVAR